MDNRHKHIEKLIDTLVIPKVNKILMEAGAPTITNVKVNPIVNPYTGIEHVFITILYKGQEGGEYVYISVSRFSHPISGMIMNIIPYVMTGNYVVILNNILTDNMDNLTYRFKSDDRIESFTHYLELLDERSRKYH